MTNNTRYTSSVVLVTLDAIVSVAFPTLLLLAQCTAGGLRRHPFTQWTEEGSSHGHSLPAM